MPDAQVGTPTPSAPAPAPPQDPQLQPAGSAGSPQGAPGPEGSEGQGDAIAATMGARPQVRPIKQWPKAPGVIQERPGESDPSDDAPIEPPEVQPEKFRVGEEEYDSEAAFLEARRVEREQLKTLRGQYKSMQKAADTAKAEVEKSRTNHQRSVEWMNYARGLEAQLAQARQGTTPQTQAPATPAATPAKPGNGKAWTPPVRLSEFDPLEAVDFDAVRQISAEQGPDAANVFMLQEALKATLAKVQEMQEEGLQPFRAQQEIQARLNQGQALFENLRMQTKSWDGTPLYPELHDDETSEAIAKLWLTNYGNLPEKALFSPLILHSAIEVWRGGKRWLEESQQGEATPAEIAPVAAAIMEQTSSRIAPAMQPTPDIDSGTQPPTSRARPRSRFDTEQYRKTGVLPDL